MKIYQSKLEAAWNKIVSALWYCWCRLTQPWPRRYMMILIEIPKFGDRNFSVEEVALLKVYIAQVERGAVGAEIYMGGLIRSAIGTPLDHPDRLFVVNLHAIGDRARWHQRIAVWIARKIIKLGE